nr:DUF3850 domain-containing protein [uncultured Marinifilum sp.]
MAELAYFTKISIDDYTDIANGRKTFVVLKNHHNYKIGEFLIFEEYDMIKQELTGASCRDRISSILKGGQAGIEKGFVVLGVSKVTENTLSERRRKTIVDNLYEYHMQSLDPAITVNEAFKKGITIGLNELIKYGRRYLFRSKKIKSRK